jgi:hypothetical protein
MPRLALVLLLSGVLSLPVLAWTKAGHMVTGAIAYDVLKKDSSETLAVA